MTTTAPGRERVLMEGSEALARMNDAIAMRRVPTRGEIEHLVEFCLAGITGVH